METAKRIWDSWDDGAIAGSEIGARLAGARICPACAPRRASTTQWTTRRGCRAAPSTARFCSRPATRPRAATLRPARQTSSFPPTRHLDGALAFRRDIVARTVQAGRGANDVLIMPASEFILAATAQEAPEKKAWVRSLQIGPQQAIAYLEQFWGRELSAYDPDGPLPDIDPVVDETSETRGSGFHGAKARQLADQWRAEAQDKGLSIRQFVTGKTNRVDATFTGSYTEIADTLARYAAHGGRGWFQHFARGWFPPGLMTLSTTWCPNCRNAASTPRSMREPRCGSIWGCPSRRTGAAETGTRLSPKQLRRGQR